MNSRFYPVSTRNAKSVPRGFSLLEILAVMAIISILMALMVPAISAFSSTTGRHGAVNVLMNAFEHARVAALEKGSDVFVVMRRNPGVGEQDALIMVSRTQDSSGNFQYTPLTRWEKLPKGVLYYQINSSLTGSGATLDSALVSALPGNVPSAQLFGIGFNRNGRVHFPVSGDLFLMLAEGTRSTGLNAVAKGASGSGQLNITERLSFRRFTGRVQLDYSAPAS